MGAYRVTWEVDVEADGPEAAASVARFLQRCEGGAAYDVFNLATGEETGVFVKEPMRPEAVT